MSGRKGHPTDAASWLRRETPKHLEVLTKLRERCAAALENRVEEDADGGRMVEPADVNQSGTPTRDWCRAWNRYQTGFDALMQRELEWRRLELLAHKQGQQPMTDDEFESEMRTLGIEAVKQLPTADLAIELASRGLTMPLVDPADRDPD